MPTSSRLATRPRNVTRPSVGSVMRLRIFSSVLLPAPLRPMMPRTSPSLDLEVDILERPEFLDRVALHDLPPAQEIAGLAAEIPQLLADDIAQAV